MRFASGNKFGRGGHRPGAGRPSTHVREICAKLFRKGVKTLCEIADDPNNRASDRIAALMVLARVGLPRQHEVSTKTPIEFEPIVIFPGSENVSKNALLTPAKQGNGNDAGGSPQ